MRFISIFWIVDIITSLLCLFYKFNIIIWHTFILSATICSVFTDYKNFLYTNILSIIGYTAIFSIIFYLICLKISGGGEIISFLIIPFTIAYYFAALSLSILIFAIEKILLRYGKKIPIYKFSNNKYYMMYLHTGLFIFFSESLLLILILFNFQDDNTFLQKCLIIILLLIFLLVLKQHMPESKFLQKNIVQTFIKTSIFITILTIYIYFTVYLTPIFKYIFSILRIC